MDFSSLLATVTYLSRNLKRGLFIRSSVLSSLLTSFGRIYRYFDTFSLTSDSHFSWLLFFSSFFFSRVTSY